MGFTLAKIQVVRTATSQAGRHSIRHGAYTIVSLTRRLPPLALWAAAIDALLVCTEPSNLPTPDFLAGFAYSDLRSELDSCVYVEYKMVEHSA